MANQNCPNCLGVGEVSSGIREAVIADGRTVVINDKVTCFVCRGAKIIDVSQIKAK